MYPILLALPKYYFLASKQRVYECMYIELLAVAADGVAYVRTYVCTAESFLPVIAAAPASFPGCAVEES